MNPNIPDSELWAMLLRGESSAFELIYKNNFHSLFQYGMRILEDEDAVGDCVHNLFVKIWENRNNLSPALNPRFYLMSSLRNIIFNYNKQQSRFEKKEINDTNYFDLKFTLESDLIRKEEVNEKATQLAAAMNQLTPRQKEIIYLKYFEELDYSEIAELMDMNVNGAYKLSARALEALRELLKIDKTLLLALLAEAKYHSLF